MSALRQLWPSDKSLDPSHPWVSITKETSTASFSAVLRLLTCAVQECLSAKLAYLSEEVCLWAQPCLAVCSHSCVFSQETHRPAMPCHLWTFGHHRVWAAWHGALQPDTGDFRRKVGPIGCVGGWADTFLPKACPETWGPHRDSLGVPDTLGAWDTCLEPGHQKPSGSEH